MRTLSMLTVLAAMSSGCGSSGPALGDPKPPTSSQMQGAVTLDTTSAQVVQATLLAKPDNVRAVLSNVILVGTQAVSSGGGAGLKLEPEDFPAACTSGDAAGGWTYTNCTDGQTTYNGTVKANASGVAIALTLKNSGQSTTTITLNGTVTSTASSTVGKLSYDLKVDVAGLGGIGGTDAANINSTIEWNITGINAAGCAIAGTTRVDYTAGGQHHAAEYTYTGCGTFTVRNG